MVCDFTKVTIDDIGSNKVIVKGAKGLPPTNYYKVSATYMNGYHVAGTLVIGGDNAKIKGKKLHLLGLLSDGGVHSHINHIEGVLELVYKHKLE